MLLHVFLILLHKLLELLHELFKKPIDRLLLLEHLFRELVRLFCIVQHRYDSYVVMPEVRLHA